MKDQFDVELSRALKSGMDKEMQNLEFTAAMRRRVLERVREEEPSQAGPAKVTAPAARNRFSTWTKSLGVVAAAAAAVTLMARIDWQGGVTEDATSPAGIMGITSAPSTKEADSNGAFATEMIPEQPPWPVVALEMPAGTPPADQHALTHENRAVEPLSAAPGAVALKAGAVAKLSADGETEWETPVEGVTDGSLLAVSPEGQFAVTTAKSVKLLDAAGNSIRDYDFASQPAQIAFSRDGALAIAQSESVRLMARDATAADIAAAEPKVAFAQDGALAVLSQNELRLYDTDGRERWSQPIAYPLNGHLTVSMDQQVVLAAGSAYSVKGDPLWTAPFPYEGVAALPGAFAIWNEYRVALLNAATGEVRFEAVLSNHEPGVRQVVGRSDGARIAILGATRAGSAVWLLDGFGTLLASRPLPGEPVDAAFLNGKLLVITPTQMVTVPTE